MKIKLCGPGQPRKYKTEGYSLRRSKRCVRSSRLGVCRKLKDGLWGVFAAAGGMSTAVGCVSVAVIGVWATVVDGYMTFLLLPMWVTCINSYMYFNLINIMTEKIQEYTICWRQKPKKWMELRQYMIKNYWTNEYLLKR